MSCSSFPSTTINVIKDVVFVGNGSFLCTFDFVKASVIEKIACFDDGTVVHGIRTQQIADNAFIVAVFGMNKARFFVFDVVLKKVIPGSGVISFDDQALDLCFIPNACVIGFAHNYVEKWNISVTQQEIRCIYAKRIEAANNQSLLYSMLLIPDGEEIYVFAGTVMNGIACWYTKNPAQVLSLQGHKGPIFKIAMNAERTRLASVSDDRTIRVWDKDGNGFRCTNVLYGHTARIWDVGFFNSDIVSCGEDLTIRSWSATGKPQGTFTSICLVTLVWIC